MSPPEDTNIERPSSVAQSPNEFDYLFRDSIGSDDSCMSDVSELSEQSMPEFQLEDTREIQSEDGMRKTYIHPSSRSEKAQTIPNDDEQGLYASDTEARVVTREYAPEESMAFGDVPRYSLREGPRKNQQVIPEWRDHDISGDFDVRAPYAPDKLGFRDKAKSAHRGSKPQGGEEIPDLKAAPSLQFSRQRGLQLPVTLHADTGTWRAKLESLQQCLSQHDNRRGRGEDNWPQEGSKPELNVTLIDAENILNHKRPKLANILDHDRPESEDQDGIYEVDIGDPRARGCRGCLSTGDACSMSAGGKYPCVQCGEEYACELILESLFKMACASCGPRNCSHAIDFEQSGPCDQCTQQDRDCVYVPLNRLPGRFIRLTDTSNMRYEKSAVMKLIQELRHATTRQAERQAGAKGEAKLQANQKVRKMAIVAKYNRSPKRGRSDELADRPSPAGSEMTAILCPCGIELCQCGPPMQQARSRTPASNSPIPQAVANPESPKRKKPRKFNKQKIRKGQRAEKKDQENAKSAPQRPKKAQGTGSAVARSSKARSIPPRSSQLPMIYGRTVYSIPHRPVERDVNTINKWKAAPTSVKLQTMHAEPQLEDQEVDISIGGHALELSQARSPPPRRKIVMSSAMSVATHFMSGALPAPPRNIGHPQQLRTRMVHPIRLNCWSKFECLWCSSHYENIFKTVIGIPEMIFEAQETEDGYMATSETHEFSNENCPKMCEAHTVRKIAAALCMHQFEPISGARRASSTNALYSAMHSDGPRFARCSICPEWAMYQCVKYFGWSTQHMDAGTAYSDGCSLQVCMNCLAGLGRHGDSVVDLVEEKLRDGGSMEALRADAHLFGHCARRVAISTGFN